MRKPTPPHKRVFVPAEAASGFAGVGSQPLSESAHPIEVVMASAQPKPDSIGDGEGRNRTGDTTVFSRVLYQLSYLARAGKSSRAAASSRTKKGGETRWISPRSSVRAGATAPRTFASFAP